MAEDSKTLSQEDVKAIQAKLEERGVQTTCPMCKSSQFAIGDGFMAHGMFKNMEGAGQLFGSKQLFPVFVLVCRNCGFTSQHSLGALGLMDLFAKKPEAARGAKND